MESLTPVPSNTHYINYNTFWNLPYRKSLIRTLNMNDQPNPPLSHLDKHGHARMVDVSDKLVTTRKAVATAIVTMQPDVRSKLLAGQLKKGEALTTAKIAAINAAKQTSQLIPMCHPLPLDLVDVRFETVGDNQIRITTTTIATARTGVEMEALTAASIAALTLYDMTKSADKSITIGPIQLQQKSGGKSGHYTRSKT